MNVDHEAGSGVARANATWRIPDYVVVRDLPSETVALNLETGRYHGLKPTAGRMLSALQRTATPAAAAAALCTELGEPAEVIERDLLELCAMLEERGLLLPVAPI